MGSIEPWSQPDERLEPSGGLLRSCQSWASRPSAAQP